MSRPFWRSTLAPAFLALVVLNLGVLVAWTLPRSLRQRSVAERAVAARYELALERARVGAQGERAAAIRANRADLERFYSTLAGSEKLDLLPTLETIEELARAPGLQPTSRTIRRLDVDKAPLERVALTWPLEGSYAELLAFLRGVERSPRFLTVDRVSLRADAESGAALQVELSMYLRQPPEARGAKRRGR